MEVFRRSLIFRDECRFKRKTNHKSNASKSMVESVKNPLNGFLESNDDSDEMFKPSSGFNERKSFVHEAFKDFDDMFAKFTANKDVPSEPCYKTPKRTYSVVDRSLVRTGEYLNKSPDEENFMPSEMRLARRQAIIDGHNDVKEILAKVGIQASEYFSVLYSSKKKKAVTEKCSTPLNSPLLCGTPDINKSNRVGTPIPISGIRQLTTSTPFGITKRSSPSRCKFLAEMSFNLSPVSTQNVIPPEIKLTILQGITCFVDVRTDKANHSESVKIELLSLGAKVEKNFTKKVSHVVFKEGRISNYLKAKKSNIPLVSILWIEACKSAIRLVDPKEYPPLQMEKYESILPFQTLKKRKLRFLQDGNGKTNSALMASQKKGASSSNKKAPTPRRAITDLKMVQRKQVKPIKEKKCTKKLDFGMEKGEIPVLELQEELELIEITDSDNFDSIKDQETRRRKTAPEDMITKKRKMNKEAEKKPVQECKDKDEPPEEDEVCSKKRKLFNPNISYYSQIEESSQTQSVQYPYPLANNKSEKRARTKLTSKRKIPKKLVTCKKESRARKRLMSLLEQEDSNVFLACSRRSSLSLFVEPKQSQTPSTKQIPTVVFTSIPPSELKDYEEMVKTLGTFEVEALVSNRTTHLVSNGPRRTINLLKGIVRGCWILDIEWVQKSYEVGKWLSEELFEMTSFSSAVLYCRLERQAFGMNYCMDLFSSCGGIYVSRNTKPPWKDLVELIKLCKGHVVTQARASSVIIGGSSCPKNLLRVNEKWVLDSITNNFLLDFNNYKVLNDDGR